jgi:hypothetical protein
LLNSVVGEYVVNGFCCAENEKNVFEHDVLPPLIFFEEVVNGFGGRNGVENGSDHGEVLSD